MRISDWSSDVCSSDLLRADGGSFASLRGLVAAGVAGGRVDAWAAASADTSDGDRDHARRHSVRFRGNVGMTLTDAITTRFYASYNSIDQQLPGALTYDGALPTRSEERSAGKECVRPGRT